MGVEGWGGNGDNLPVFKVKETSKYVETKSIAFSFLYTFLLMGKCQKCNEQTELTSKIETDS